MKLLVSSDWHLDAMSAGVPRFAEVQRAVEHAVATAKRERVDLFLFLGDLCDPDASRAPRCVAFAIQVAADLSRSGIPSRWLVGNHDVIEDGSGTSTLSPLAAASEHLPLSVPLGERPLVERPVRVYERPTAERIGDQIVFALPFVPRAAAYDPEAVLAAWAGEAVPNEDPTIILGHLNVPGVIPASESDEYARGRDLWLPVETIRKRWPKATVLNGHYHGGQVAPGDVIIPGAPARFTHGEASHEPACLVVEVP